MKIQAFNPYMPSWEYVPDAEPHVFGDRVYVYGSHDFFNGYVFCMGDYVCYSASVTNLREWKYEGVIYRRDADPANKEGKMCLYAPDVTQGPDGRYYMYYVYDKISYMSVAVCDTPAGQYKFLGYVHYKDGTLLGQKENDIPQFDPAVLTEGDKTYLYSGFCGVGDKTRPGAIGMVLGKDMLTIEEEPVVVAPGSEYGKGTSFEGHEFFEGSSIRKFNGTYYFVYSSRLMHELCYATSKNPLKDFVYRGCIVSNADMNIDTYKPKDMPANYGANNHGGLECINGQYYIFYHRHTNGTWYSRQGCAEKVTILPDGTIPQAEITSCGLNGAPLEGKGFYPAYTACNMFTEEPSVYVAGDKYPKIIQDGKDGDENPGYIANIKDGTTFGFKYLDFKDTKEISIYTRCYMNGYYEIKTEWNGQPLAKIEINNSNVWEKYTAPVSIPDGVHALYFTYHGTGMHHFKGFEIN